MDFAPDQYFPIWAALEGRVVELESWSQEPDLAVEASASLHQAAVCRFWSPLRRFDLVGELSTRRSNAGDLVGFNKKRDEELAVRAWCSASLRGLSDCPIGKCGSRSVVIVVGKGPAPGVGVERNRLRVESRSPVAECRPCPAALSRRAPCLTSDLPFGTLRAHGSASFWLQSSD